MDRQLRSERTPSARATEIAASNLSTQPTKRNKSTTRRNVQSVQKRQQGLVDRRRRNPSSTTGRSTRAVEAPAKSSANTASKRSHPRPSTKSRNRARTPDLPDVDDVLRDASVADLIGSLTPPAISRSPSSSSSPEVCQLESLTFDVRLEIYVGKAFVIGDVLSAARFDIEHSIDQYCDTLSKDYERRRQRIRKPAFGGVATVSVGTNVRFRQSIKTDHDFNDIRKKWWEIHHREKKLPAQISVVVKLSYETEDAGDEELTDFASDDEALRHEDSTQTRRRRSRASQSRPERRDRSMPTASQRQRLSTANDRLVETMVGDHLIEINETHVCKVPSCRNYPRPCVPLPGYGHLFLNLGAVKKWNQLIKDGDATVRECPVSVVADLLAERRRTEDRKASAKAADLPNGPGSVINQFFGGAQGLNVDEPRSSPPQRAGDDDANMRSYLEWLGTKYPSSAFELDGHARRLAEEGWGFSDLRDATNEDWRRMGIGGGFVKKIQKHLKEWSKLTVEVMNGGDGEDEPLMAQMEVYHGV